LFDSFDESTPFHQVYFFEVVANNPFDQVVELVTYTGLVLNFGSKGSGGIPNGSYVSSIDYTCIGFY
jgi:hypothetical protein